MRNGTSRVLTIFGMPVGVHFTLPLVPLLAARFRFEPGIYAGTLLVIGVHALGQLTAAGLVRTRPRALVLHGLGSRCRLASAGREATAVAWGGLLAQAGLLAIALSIASHHPPNTSFARGLLEGIVRIGTGLLVLNLLPFRLLDGGDAWAFLRRARRRAEAPIAEHAGTMVREALEQARREALRRPDEPRRE